MNSTVRSALYPFYDVSIVHHWIAPSGSLEHDVMDHYMVANGRVDVSSSGGGGGIEIPVVNASFVAGSGVDC